MHAVGLVAADGGEPPMLHGRRDAADVALPAARGAAAQDHHVTQSRHPPRDASIGDREPAPPRLEMALELDARGDARMERRLPLEQARGLTGADERGAPVGGCEAEALAVALARSEPFSDAQPGLGPERLFGNAELRQAPGEAALAEGHALLPPGWAGPADLVGWVEPGRGEALEHHCQDGLDRQK